MYDNWRTLEGVWGLKTLSAGSLSVYGRGNIEFAVRRDVDLKNLLSTGDVSVPEVINVIMRAGGADHRMSSHHYDSSVDVHIITVTCAGLHWYIKWYFDEPASVFISVHH